MAEFSLGLKENFWREVRGRRNHVNGISGAVGGAWRVLGGQVEGIKEGINGGFLGEVDIDVPGGTVSGGNFMTKEVGGCVSEFN